MPTRDEIIDQVHCGTQIADEASKAGCMPELIADNGKQGDAHIAIYSVDGAMVADTNGNAVWNDSDPEGFADLAQQCNAIPTPKEIGTKIGNAIARDVIADSHDPEWTGITAEDADQIPDGMDISEVERHAKAAYEAAIKAAK